MTCPKVIENLAAFSARKATRAAATENEEKERIISMQKENESRSKRRSRPMSFLKIEGRKTFLGGERAEKRRWLVDLLGDQIPSPKAPFRSKRGRERREQRRCEERSDYQRRVGV